MDGGVGGKMLIGWGAKMSTGSVVDEGERGKLKVDPVLNDSGLDGGLYVIATPLCNPVRSRFGASNATVTSPGTPVSENPGTGIRCIVSSLRSSKRFIASTFSG